MIKTCDDKYAENLYNALRKKYAIKVNKKPTKYIGFDLKFNDSHDLSKRSIEMSMNNYVLNVCKHHGVEITTTIKAITMTQVIKASHTLVAAMMSMLFISFFNSLQLVGFHNVVRGDLNR
jgi:hypothetical protein